MLTIFSLLTLAFVSFVVNGAKLSIKNNGPVIRGSNLTFVAEVTDAWDVEYEWTWTDDAKPKDKIIKKGRHNCTLTRNYSNVGKFTMKVKVTYFVATVVRGENQFEISDTIPGNLWVYQGDFLMPEGSYLSSENETLLVAQIHDPSGFFNNALIYYMWNIDSENVGGERGPNLTHIFPPNKNWRVLVIVTAYLKGEIFGGSLTARVKSRAPIVGINVTGNIILERGDMVDLQVACDGSSPWSYCWMAVPEINGTDLENETCTDIVVTTSCDFTMLYYFGKSGHHQMLVNISNDVSRQILRQDITIYNAVPEPQLSTVIMPVICSLLAVAIVVVGIFYFIQSRHRFTVEVADFDFTSSDSFTYRTFCEQLKDAIANALPSSSGMLCVERRWSFLDCRAEPEGQAQRSSSESVEDILASLHSRHHLLTESAEE